MKSGSNGPLAVTVVNPGMGNIRSVAKALEAVGAQVKVTQDPQEIKKARCLVVPGVGAFGDCLKHLRDHDILEEVRRAAEEARQGQNGRYYLGICLGLQILFEKGEEFGAHAGLGVFKGEVKRLPDNAGCKIPNMGWSDIQIQERALKNSYWQGIEEPIFYFVHSYVVVPKDSAVIAAECDFGSARPFAAAVQEGNLVAVQFHPEKSQDAGLRFLKNCLKAAGEGH